jgi:hypothetical protein
MWKEKESCEETGKRENIHTWLMFVQCEEKEANRKRKNAKKRVNGINKYVKKWTNEEGEEDSKP